MRLLAIDPGTTESAFVVLDGLRICMAMIVPNEKVLNIIKQPIVMCGAEGAGLDAMAIEMIQGLGMPVGKETFETVWWIGRFCEASPVPFHRVYRKDIKLHLCGQSRAKDMNIRAALLDKLGPQGTKKLKGATYGISKHMWSALAVGVTYLETSCHENKTT